MPKTSRYSARVPDAKGIVHYTDGEHQIWHELMARQLKVLPERACDDFLLGLDELDLRQDAVPQLEWVNRVLVKATGWQVERVPALIPFERFFQLLANKRFPAATFIRRREDMDYLQEPDIFHEIFGHCPLLTNPYFADFTENYGRLGLMASPEDRVYLARLYWLTIEFGLVMEEQGMRIYGGGILSSSEETLYCLDSDQPQRAPFDLLEVLRTPYRIDILQPIYFVIEEMRTLYEVTKLDVMGYVNEAKRRGLFKPKFEPFSGA
jgi:phenylalanine-4-hydroxylase